MLPNTSPPSHATQPLNSARTRRPPRHPRIQWLRSRIRRWRSHPPGVKQSRIPNEGGILRRAAVLGWFFRGRSCWPGRSASSSIGRARALVTQAPSEACADQGRRDSEGCSCGLIGRDQAFDSAGLLWPMSAAHTRGLNEVCREIIGDIALLAASTSEMDRRTRSLTGFAQPDLVLPGRPLMTVPARQQEVPPIRLMHGAGLARGQGLRCHPPGCRTDEAPKPWARIGHSRRPDAALSQCQPDMALPPAESG